jgi:hypothetical protein
VELEWLAPGAHVNAAGGFPDGRARERTRTRARLRLRLEVEVGVVGSMGRLFEQQEALRRKGGNVRAGAVGDDEVGSGGEAREVEGGPGAGAEGAAGEVEVRWPSGAVRRVPVAAGVADITLTP